MHRDQWTASALLLLIDVAKLSNSLLNDSELEDLGDRACALIEAASLDQDGDQEIRELKRMLAEIAVDSIRCKSALNEILEYEDKSPVVGISHDRKFLPPGLRRKVRKALSE